MSIRALNATDYATLARAQRDIEERGRMRGSSEVHGNNTASRSHMLESLRRLEAMGHIERAAYQWNSGRVTASGLHILETVAAPQRRPQAVRGDLGIAPDGGTRFKKALVELGESPILINGNQSPKLGTRIRKGRHKGLPMRYVQLEEGRTCPDDCALRSRCYGGNMFLAKRLIWRGEKTGEAIAGAIAKAPRSMIRLHNLGDFPSIGYARNVMGALATSGSAAFGFTHHRPETTLGYALRVYARENWDWFSLRTSYLHGTRKPIPERSAVIVSHPDQAKEHNAVVCPEQMGKVASCAECGFCWHSQRPVAFVLHEQLAKLKREAPAPDPLKVAA